MTLAVRSCKDCGKPPEDTPEKMILVVVDERRLQIGLCRSCFKKRLGE